MGAPIAPIAPIAKTQGTQGVVAGGGEGGEPDKESIGRRMDHGTMSVSADRELSGLVSRRFVFRTPHTTMTVSDGKVTQKSVQKTLFVRHGLGEIA